VRYSLRKKVWILNAICTITRFLIFLLHWPWFNYFVLNNFLKHNSWNPYVIQAIRVCVLRNIPTSGWSLYIWYNTAAYTVCITYRLQCIFYVSIPTCCDFLSSVCPLRFFSCRSLCNFSPVPIEFHTWWSPGVVFPSWTFEFPQILLRVEGFHFHIPDRKIDLNHLCCYTRKPKLNYLYLYWIALSVLNCSS
jgi:hypothetical protein